jgi:IclR family acetate operon transcriptional repressor
VSAVHIVAISVPAPTDRFQANEKRIVEALRSAAEAAPWTR